MKLISNKLIKFIYEGAISEDEQPTKHGIDFTISLNESSNEVGENIPKTNRNSDLKIENQEVCSGYFF